MYKLDERRGTYKLDEAGKRLTDALDDTALHLACFDSSGDVQGCLRANWVHNSEFPDYLREYLQLNRLERMIDPRSLTYSSLFMVEKTLRGMDLSRWLAMTLFHEGLQRKVVADVQLCELNLVRYYEKIGYRPYLPVLRLQNGGVRVPLLLCLRDRDYLRRIDSALAPLVEETLDDRGETAQEIRRHFPDFQDPRIEPTSQESLWAGLAAGPGAEDPKAGVFKGVNYRDVAKTLELSPIKLDDGQVLYTIGEKEEGLVVVERGCLGIYLSSAPDAQPIAFRGPGEPVGEIHCILGTGRTAHVKAIGPTTVLLLSPRYIDKVALKDPVAGGRLALNMCRILARKLADESLLLSRCMAREGLPPPTPLTRSYESPSLVEQQRLQGQASALLEREIALLRSLGLRDGQRILDVGCGQGVLDVALARRHERCDVYGLDSNASLLAEAKERASSLENCHFDQGDAMALPYHDASFDFVFCRFAMQHFAEPVRAVQEMARVLRPGANLVLIDVDDGGIMLHPEPAQMAWVMSAVQRIKQAQGANRRVGRALAEHVRHTGAFEGICFQVISMSSADLPMDRLVDMAFSFRTEILRSAGLDNAKESLDWLQALECCRKDPNSLLVVPIFVVSAARRDDQTRDGLA
jgi:ubiquinone/menaquinone biosynthesis C-methylase UbiE